MAGGSILASIPSTELHGGCHVSTRCKWREPVGSGTGSALPSLATVLTRGYAGRLTDHFGGKRAALQGAAVCALGGLLYLVSAMPGLSPEVSLAIIVVGRLAAGFGESQFVTGCVSWSIASVGPQRAGMSMSWTGIAMFAALAIGAPVGMALYQSYGLQAAMIACIVAPLIAAVIAFREVSYTSPSGLRLPLYQGVGQIWREG